MTSQDPRRIAYWLLKEVNRAIYTYQMIRPGERIAVAVSGGKDSLSPLRLLDWRRGASPDPYDLVAIHVRGDARGREMPAHPLLESWLREQGYVYRIAETFQNPGESRRLGCQRCAWNRCRTLFETAAEMGCSALAYGHHADDLAQITLLDLCFHGRVESMAPIRNYFGRRLRLLRPCCFLAEDGLGALHALLGSRSLRRYSPQAHRTQRELARNLPRATGRNYGQVRANLVRAGLRYGGRIEDID